MSDATQPPRRRRRAVPDAATAAEYDAAWQAGLPAKGPTWTARPWVDPALRAAEDRAALAQGPIDRRGPGLDAGRLMRRAGAAPALE